MTKNTATDAEFVSWREFLSGNHKTALAMVSLAVWLHAADSLIVATMLPSLIGDIGGDAYVPWTLSLYEIGSIIAGASSALVTLKLGLQRPLAVAAFLFSLGCALSALAPSMGVVLAGRLVQGFSGGGMVAMAFIAVGVFFPSRYMPRAMATVSLIWGTSAFLGPLIGGFFVEYANWRWGFGFFAIQALVLSTWIALARGIPDKTPSTAPSAQRIPIVRLLMLASSVLSIAYAGIFVDPVITPLLIVVGLGFLVLFLRIDAKSTSSQLLPTAPWNITTPTGAVMIMLICLTIATIAISAYGPILVTLIHDASALTAGYIVACSSIGWTLAAVSVSGSPERFDRFFIALGVTTITVSIVGFIFAVPHGPIWLIALMAGLDGAGFGMAWTFILRTATKNANPTQVQRISGAFPTVQRFGYAIGAAFMGIIANVMGFHAEMSGAEAAAIARTLFLSSLPFAALGLIAMLCFVWPRTAHDPKTAER